MAVNLCHAVTSYANSSPDSPDSPDFCVAASIAVLCASKVNKRLYKLHICVAYSNSILGTR